MVEMEEEEQEAQHIYEAREAKMVSFKDGKTKWRIARFLLPLAKDTQNAFFVPHNTLLLSDVHPHTLPKWPLKVVPKGWNCPQHKWKQWVHQLAPKYESIWKRIGIREAILSSTFELRYDQEILIGLSEFWSTQTNTFLFPWGEATITLEDVMVLGGYPLLGEDVSSLVSEDLERVVEGVENFRREMLKSKVKKADHAAWLKKFMEEGENHEYEHVAFLSLWLTRYVFPSLLKDTLENHVFPIAAKLSKGLKVALGPAVLANIYHKLRGFTESALACSKEETLVVPGDFQLVQVWAFERFPALAMGPKCPNFIYPGEPRMARWHKVNTKLNLPLIRSALRLAENFEWRPYVTDLENCLHPSYYKENEQLMFDYLSLDKDLLSYIRCLQVSELVGTDGRKEKYMPHRVAMQFGLDQDLPSNVLNFKCASEILSAFVPSRSFQPGVSVQYSNWWKDSMIAREAAIKDVLMQRKNLKDLRTSAVQANGRCKEQSHSPVETRNIDEHLNCPFETSSSIEKRPPNAKRKVVHKTYSSDEECLHFLPSHARKTGRPKPSSELMDQAEQRNGKIPEVSVGLKNPKSSPEDSEEFACSKSHTNTSPKVKMEVYENPSDDDFTRSYRFRKVSTSGLKEKSCNPTKEVRPPRSSVHASEKNGKVSDREKESIQDSGMKAPRKMRGGDPMNPIDIDDEDDADDPIDDDDHLHSCSKRFSKHGNDLEERIQKVEKMLGLSKD